VDIGTGAN